MAAERESVDVGGDIVEHAARVAGVEKREDVGVREVREELDLTDKPLANRRIFERRAQHLDRDQAVVLEVLGKVDARHRPVAEVALGDVPSRKCAGELLENEIFHTGSNEDDEARPRPRISRISELRSRRSSVLQSWPPTQATAVRAISREVSETEQPKPEPRPHAHLATHSDSPMMRLDDPLRDREPQPNPPAIRRRRLPETFKHLL